MIIPSQESLTVEFKSDVKCLGYDKLIDELVAMANTDGGQLYLGVEDDGTITGVNVQHRNRYEMRSRVQERTKPPLFVDVSLAEAEGQQIAVFSVSPSRHLTMTADGKYLQRRLKRDGTPEVVPLGPVQLQQRFTELQEVDPSATILEDLTIDEAFSEAEQDRLRSIVAYQGEPGLPELPDSELWSALGLIAQRQGVWRPTLAGLLMIGREALLREHVPTHEVLFQVLDDMAVIYNSPSMRSPILKVFEKVTDLFEARISEQEIFVDLKRVPIPNFDRLAFREGFVNALVHRDYYRLGAVQVQIHLGNLPQVRIISPGGFAGDANPENILRVRPAPRNFMLADAAKRVGLAERTGRGIDKIYAGQLRNGHGFPDFSASSGGAVVLDMYSPNRQSFVENIIRLGNRLGRDLSLNELIAAELLREQPDAGPEIMARRAEIREDEARQILADLDRLGFRNRIQPTQQAPADELDSEGDTSYSSTKATAQTRQWMTMILNHLSVYDRITRREIIHLCNCTGTQATWLLKRMKEAGRIESHGVRRGTYYTLAGDHR